MNDIHYVPAWLQPDLPVLNFSPTYHNHNILSVHVRCIKDIPNPRKSSQCIHDRYLQVAYVIWAGNPQHLDPFQRLQKEHDTLLAYQNKGRYKTTLEKKQTSLPYAIAQLREPWNHSPVGEALRLYFAAKTIAENRALDKNGSTQLFVFDLGGVDNIWGAAAVGRFGLITMLQSVGTPVGLHFRSHKPIHLEDKVTPTKQPHINVLTVMHHSRPRPRVLSSSSSLWYAITLRDCLVLMEKFNVITQSTKPHQEEGESAQQREFLRARWPRRTRMKELQVDIKQILETMELHHSEYDAHFGHLETTNTSCLDRIEASLETLINKSSTHGALNSLCQPSQVRNVKLEFPRFVRKYVMEWSFNVEQFFEYYDTPDVDRLTIAAMHLDQEVIPWFQMMQRSHPFQSWQVFTRALELDFGPSLYDCPRATTSKLIQTGSVNDYYMEFTSLANREHIRRNVMAHSPISLLKEVALAQLFEEKYSSIPKPFHTATISKNQPTNISFHNKYTAQPLQTHILTPKSQAPTTLPLTNPNYHPYCPLLQLVQQTNFKTLRRQKDLCYTSDEKFSFNHKCPNKHLRILQVDEEVIPEPEPPDTTQAALDGTPLVLHLLLNALKVASGVDTIKFTGQIGGISVQILVDDNFLQPRVEQFLNLPIEPAFLFKVLVGNDHSMAAEGLIQNLNVSVQGHELQLPVYLLPISGADLILGATWLATLGPHMANYSALSLKFYHEGKFIKLWVTSTSSASSHKMIELHSCYTRIIYSTIHWTRFTSRYFGRPELATLQLTYRSVFNKPTGLPPPTTQNHLIPLLDDAKPMKVRPFGIRIVKKNGLRKWSRRCLMKGSFSQMSYLMSYLGLNTSLKLDLRSGCHQILVEPADQYMTSFRTHQGHYKWLVMPFGLTNAPTSFQCLMNQIFQPLLRKYVLCSFGKTEVDYLGHTVSGKGVAMDKTKIQAVDTIEDLLEPMLLWPPPLTNLSKKDSFTWTPKTVGAFSKLKLVITSALVLALPDFTQSFVIETNASGIGVGAVLSQSGHPIAYFSKN
ncbi:Retrovirus-related Pol polyprotein from transposon 17.6, partial [Mucuna pruriens]